MRCFAVALVLVVGACGSSNSDAPGDGQGGDGAGDGAGGDGTGADGSVVDAPPDPCVPGTWCTETAPGTPTILRSVWAASTDEVFAVGNGGTILHRQNLVWTAMNSPTSEDLKGVWGASSTDVWAVGNAGTILRYDGTDWTATGNITSDLEAVWGSGPNDVWIVGTGKVVHYNGSTFEPRVLTGHPLSVSGTGPTDVWVTGENAQVAHFTGTWTTGIDPGAGITYFAIVALAANDVWITTLTSNKETLEFGGSTWTPHAAPATGFLSIHPVSSNDIWAAGATRVGHWNGTDWTIEKPAGNVIQLMGTGGSGSSLWIVGTESTILHRR